MLDFPLSRLIDQIGTPQHGNQKNREDLGDSVEVSLVDFERQSSLGTISEPLDLENEM